MKKSRQRLLIEKAMTHKNILKELRHDLEDMGVKVKQAEEKKDSDLVIKKKDNKKLEKALKKLDVDDTTLEIMLDIVPLSKKIYIRQRIA